MQISDEAVEAAAKAQFEKWHPEEKWDDRPDIQRIFRRDARAALDAAAPYIAAQALNEAASKITDPYFKSTSEWLRALASDEF